MKISVIIPVYGEEKNINSAISAVKGIAGETDYEIVVVDGGPGESTLKSIKDENTVKLVSLPGRSKQMNAGAARAAGEVLLFLHADTRLPEGAFEDIREAMKDKNINGGAFSLSIDTKNIFLKFIAFTANIRSRFLRIPYGDQAIFFRKKYFDAIGGYKDIPLMEDLEIMGRLKKNKEMIAVLSSRAVTSARRWEKEGILRATLRNKFIKFMYNLGVRPEKLAQYYK